MRGAILVVWDLAPRALDNAAERCTFRPDEAMGIAGLRKLPTRTL